MQLDWRDVLRRGFMPQMSDAGLDALAEALRTNDPALIRNETVRQDEETGEVAGCCPVTYPEWIADDLATFGQIQERFRERCDGCEDRLGEQLAHRYFLNAVDDGTVTWPELLAEVEAEQHRRAT